MDYNKFLYKSNISKETLGLLEKMIFNPFQLFEMISKDVDVESIDQNFWKRFYGIPNFRESPGYLKKMDGFSQEMRAIFILLSYILFCKQGLGFFSGSQLSMLKGTCSYSSKSSHSRILYILLKYSMSSFISKNKGKETFSIDFTNALRTPSFGKCLKDLLIYRISYCYKINHYSITNEDFFGLCKNYNFASVFGLPDNTFEQWLNGELFGEYIEKTRIQKFLCIEDILLEFDKAKEIYFLGENGDGKTLILDSLFLTFSSDRINSITDKGVESVKKIQAKAKESNCFLFGCDNLLSVYGSDISSSLQNLFAYGTHRGRVDTLEGKDVDKYGFLTLFDTNMTLINPSEWLYKYCCSEAMELLSVSESSLAETRVLVQTKIDTKLKQVQSVFNTILVGKDVKVFFDESDNYSIKYKEKNAILDFEELSEGFRTTIIFVCDLLYRLSKGDTKINAEDVMKTKAVVLIDEIDAHLHPRWQRTIVSSLRQLFPNIQFIMTTHSPHVIQGASQDALIYRVYRNENGKTCISEAYHREKLNYMMINTLATSPLFSLDDARMDSNCNDSDTSDSYLISRIEQLVREDIARSNLSSYLTPSKLDELIQKAKNKALSEPYKK